MNIFVARLNFDTTESTLQDAFESFGEVSSAKIIMDKYSGKSKGFGFVEMPDDEAAQQAIDSLDDTEIDGRTIVVKQAEDRPRRSGGGGGGFNRGGGGGGFNRGGGGGGFSRGGDRGGFDRSKRY